MDNFKMLTESDARELLGNIQIDMDKHRSYMIEKGFKRMEVSISADGKAGAYFVETIFNPDGSHTEKIHNLDDRFGTGDFLYTTAI